MRKGRCPTLGVLSGPKCGVGAVEASSQWEALGSAAEATLTVRPPKDQGVYTAVWSVTG